MNRTRWLHLALLALIILAALALRLYRLDFQDIWWDEARNIDVASRPLAQIATAPELDIHPPVYFYGLHFWMVLGGKSAFAIRFMSLWFGVLLAPLMYALGRRVGGWWVGLGAALGAAFLPFLLGEAQEARMYTMALVWLVAAGTQIANRKSQSAIRNPQSAISKWGLFALFSALALLTHYAAVFALIALWGWAAGWALSGTGRMRWERVARVGLAALGTALLCLPGLPVALRQIPSYRNPNLTVPSVGAYLADLGRFFSLGDHIDPGPARPWLVTLAILLAGGLLLALWSFADRQISESANSVPRSSGHRQNGYQQVPRGHDVGERYAIRSTQYAYHLNNSGGLSSRARHLARASCGDRELLGSAWHVSPGLLRRYQYAIFALVWAVLPLVIYYLVIRNRSTFAPRYISFALPGWLLLVGLALRGWADLPMRFRAVVLRSRAYAARGATKARSILSGAPPQFSGAQSKGAVMTKDAPARFDFSRQTASTSAQHASTAIPSPKTWSYILGMLAVLAFVVALAPGFHGDLTDARYFREDTSGLVAWLKANTGPDDLILVDQRYPFGFYYERWNNAFDGYPPAEPAEMAPAQYLFVDINTVADRLTTLAQGHERVFWVRWFESDTDPRGAVPFLLEKFGTQSGERRFRGYAVTWYAVAPDAHFELAPALTDLSVNFGDQVQMDALAFGGRGGGLTSRVVETRTPTAPADKLVWATVRWERLPGAAGPLKATLVLEDAAGLVVGHDDRPVLNDRHLAPPYWSDADAPLGVYLIHPDPATPPGHYTLKLAVYDPATLEKLATRGAMAQGDFVTLGQVELTRATAPPTKLPLDMAVDFAWEGVRLLGRGPLPETVSPGGVVPLDLYWRAEDGDLPNLRVRLALRDATGGSFSQADAAPVSGRYPTMAWAEGEVVRDHRRWRLDPATPPGTYRVALALVTGDAMVSPSVALGQLTVAGRPHSFALPAEMAVRSGARIGDFAQLLGFDLAPRVPTPGSDLTLTIYWQASGASDVQYTVSAQLLDADGILRAQRDQPPGDGAFPTTGWLAGEILTDTYRIALPADLQPGRYALMLSMYDPVTGSRLPVTATGGTSVGDALRLMTVEVR